MISKELTINILISASLLPQQQKRRKYCLHDMLRVLVNLGIVNPAGV